MSPGPAPPPPPSATPPPTPLLLHHGSRASGGNGGSDKKRLEKHELAKGREEMNEKAQGKEKKKKEGDGKAKGDGAGDNLVLVQTPCCTQLVTAVSQEVGDARVGSRALGMRRCVVTAKLTQGPASVVPAGQGHTSPVTQPSHRQLLVSS